MASPRRIHTPRPYEFLDPQQITSVEFRGHGSHNQKAGTWSDDGALMLGLLDSLLRARDHGEPGFDTTDQAKRFLAWADDRQYTPDGDGSFDIGSTTSRALARFRSGMSAEGSGPSDEHSQGNGSLMRILPVALVEHDIPYADLVDHAHRASAVTHGHPVAQATCALYSLVARHLLTGTSRAAAMERARETLRKVYSARADANVRLPALDLVEGWRGRSGRTYVPDSFWSAWEAFAESVDYGATIQRTVRYGNDTDTTACIAGGLAGIHWGIDGIPAAWLAGMRGRAIVAPLVDRLIATDGRLTSSGNPLRVYWVDLQQVPLLAHVPGRLGMTFLPGKRRDGQAGSHWRDLEADVARLRDDLHVDTLFLLPEDHELQRAHVPGIADALAAHGVELVRCPVPDELVPTDRRAFRAALDGILLRLRDGRSVAVACVGGLGRTGTAVACLLRDGGLASDDAIELTRATHQNTIGRGMQEAFVRGWDWPGHLASIAEED